MELIRIKAYQPFACYRKPFSYGFWDTYPLPPFSTILGWVHWVLGESEREDKLLMNIGVTGKFDAITYDLQRLIKFDRKRKSKNRVVLEGFNKALDSTPTYVANVTNIHLRIYLQMEDKYLQRFKDRVLQVNYPSLGRYEDLLRIDEVDFMTPVNKKIGGFDESIEINYPIYLRPETAEKIGTKGSNFRLPFYHQEVNGLRFFEKEKTVFTDSASIDSGSFLIDEEDDDYFKNPVLVDLFGEFTTASSQ